MSDKRTVGQMTVQVQMVTKLYKRLTVRASMQRWLGAAADWLSDSTAVRAPTFDDDGLTTGQSDDDVWVWAVCPGLTPDV